MAQVHLREDITEQDRAPESIAPESGVRTILQADDPGSWVAAARHGHDGLARAAAAGGIQSVIGLDADFNRTIEPRALRAFVRDRLGADIGFDAGDEAFSSMIALKVFRNDRATATTVALSLPIVRGRAWRGRYRFFCDENGFAADTDCTGVAAAALYEAGQLTEEELVASGEQILLAAAPESVPASANLDDATGKSNGELRANVVMVYWEDGLEPGAAPRGRKQDAGVAANALYTLLLAREHGLDDPRGVIEATLGYVRDHLRSGAYLEGTRYYPSPDTFLFYASCLCRRFLRCRIELGKDLRRALHLRSAAPACPGNAADPAGPLNVAQRMLAACNLGMSPRWNPRDLLSSQREDGTWPAAAFYSLGKRALYFGSRAVTTMFVVGALEAALKTEQRGATPSARTGALPLQSA